MSSNPEKMVRALLKEHGVWVRRKRHDIYKFFGESVAISTTPSDDRGWLNKLHEMRRIMKTQEGVRCRI